MPLTCSFGESLMPRPITSKNSHVHFTSYLNKPGSKTGITFRQKIVWLSPAKRSTLAGIAIPSLLRSSVAWFVSSKDPNVGMFDSDPFDIEEKLGIKDVNASISNEIFHLLSVRLHCRPSSSWPCP